MININYSNAAREATIDIDGTIGLDLWSETPEANTHTSIKNQLKEISNMKAETINVNINSLGGDVNDGLAIHDALATHSATVNVMITGMTASAATIIAMAGDTIEMSDNALFLVHKAWTMAMGNKNNIDAVGDGLDTIDNLLANIYAKRTEMSVDEAHEVMNRNNGDGEWLTASEALEMGFIDSIFEPMHAVATIPSKEITAMKLPDIPLNKINNKMSDVKETPEFTNELKELKEGQNSILDSIKNFFNGKEATAETTEEVETVDFEAVNAELTSELETLKADLEAKTNEIDTLKSDRVDIDTQIEALNAKIEDYSNTVLGSTVKAEQPAEETKRTVKGFDMDLYNKIKNK